MFVAIALAVGVAIGYGFRGYISRTKSAAGAAVRADTGKIIAGTLVSIKSGVTKEVSKL